jgi:succinate dehydrogenase/fumarate reductase iron-sulfur protein
MAGATATFRIWRGDGQGGRLQDYATEVTEGMVVLDAVHQIQARSANDLAVRWNCKAGKCGSCSAEVNGNPRLMCMTRLNELDLSQPVTIEPMRAFPPIRDLVTDVSWNFKAKKSIKRFKPRPPDAPDGTWRVAQVDVERVQEFRKCIECFLCQDVCHVLRDRNASARHRAARPRSQAIARRRVLQHHQVLHHGVPREHHHHRQCDHPAEGARDRSAVRPGRQAVPDVPFVRGPRWNSN